MMYEGNWESDHYVWKLKSAQGLPMRFLIVIDSGLLAFEVCFAFF